jgi:hypothetical protein
MTIKSRNEQGDVLQKGQISTAPVDVDEFFVAFTKKARKLLVQLVIIISHSTKWFAALAE